jgi:hypothetical protein
MAYQVLKQEMLDVPFEGAKESEEVLVAVENVGEWALITGVVTSNAFQGQIKPILNLRVRASALIDRRHCLSVDASSQRKDGIGTYCASKRVEVRDLLGRNLRHDSDQMLWTCAP